MMCFLVLEVKSVDAMNRSEKMDLFLLSVTLDVVAVTTPEDELDWSLR